MYAIMLDIDWLKEVCRDSDKYYDIAFDAMKTILKKYGFNHHQGNIFFGEEGVNAVTCVLAAQALSHDLIWFSASIQEIRMLRITENYDLMPAIK